MANDHTSSNKEPGKLIYDTPECMKLIKKKYPYIPYWIIRRVLYAEDLYMYKQKIIKYKPELDWFEL